MLLNPKIDFSSNEFNTYSSALVKGVRNDGRDAYTPRQLIFQKITQPGVATVHLGNTVVSAVTTAKLVTPSQNSPSKGMHLIYLFTESNGQKSRNDTLTTYLRMVWMNAHVLEEESLCVKIGEKVWQLVTRVIVHDDDSGFIEAAFAAIIASLGTLRFPAFDTNTGSLFNPTQRRSYSIAFSTRPICVISAFIDTENQGKRVCIPLADPTRIEQLVTPRYSLYVFNDHFEQIYLDSYLPIALSGQSDVFEMAQRIAKQWKAVVDDAINDFVPDEKYCVGNPEDFAGYVPNKFFLHQTGEIKHYTEIEVWRGDLKEKFVLDMSDNITENQNNELKNDNKESNNTQDWLFSSLSN